MPTAASGAVIYTLPVILACALLGASEARAVTCDIDANACQPFVATIEQVGPNAVVTGSGEFDLTGLMLAGPTGGRALIWPDAPIFIMVTSEFSGFSPISGRISGPSNFGPGTGALFADSSNGDPVAFNISQNVLGVPFSYVSGNVLTSQMIFDNYSISPNPPPEFVPGILPVRPGVYTWTWGNAPDESFTIDVVPGPIVGAGLPGLIAALGGLVAMARRRRKQLA